MAFYHHHHIRDYMRLSKESPCDAGRGKDWLGPCRVPQRKDNDIMSLPTGKGIVGAFTIPTHSVAWTHGLWLWH